EARQPLAGYDTVVEIVRREPLHEGKFALQRNVFAEGHAMNLVVAPAVGAVGVNEDGRVVAPNALPLGGDDLGVHAGQQVGVPALSDVVAQGADVRINEDGVRLIDVRARLLAPAGGPAGFGPYDQVRLLGGGQVGEPNLMFLHREAGNGR